MKKLLAMMLAVFALTLGVGMNAAEARKDVLVGYMNDNLEYIYLDADTVKVLKHDRHPYPSIDDAYLIYATYYTTGPKSKDLPLTFIHAVAIKDDMCLVKTYSAYDLGKPDAEAIDTFLTTDDDHIFSIKIFLTAWEAVYGSNYPFPTIKKSYLDLVTTRH